MLKDGLDQVKTTALDTQKNPNQWNPHGIQGLTIYHLWMGRYGADKIFEWAIQDGLDITRPNQEGLNAWDWMNMARAYLPPKKDHGDWFTQNERLEHIWHEGLVYQNLKKQTALAGLSPSSSSNASERGKKYL